MSAAAEIEVEALLARLARWSRERPDVRAVALVGSWAYGAPRADSDVDVVLLSHEPALYTDGEANRPATAR
ncbi:MAG: nucleotidyltransferase domain-containing protein [Actinomycetota bacterium]|nr:nucleotidyltransferase domain-containing protein [Actinomycetota bacterium]